MKSTSTPRVAFVALLITSALVITACGSQAEPDTQPQPSAPVDTSGELAAGCEDVPMDVRSIEAIEPPARCEPGTPAAQPLAEPVTIKVASNQLTAEYTAAIQVADAMGEFEKENIVIEYVNLPYADAAPQIAGRAIDVGIGGLDAAFFSAGAQDLGLRAVLGLHVSPHAGNTSIPQAGLWCRADAFSAPADPDLSESADMSWGSSVGRGSVGVIQAVIQLQQEFPDTDFTGLDVQTVPAADIATAMANEALDCGYIIDPIWLSLSPEDYVLVTTQLEGVSASQVTFGPTLLEDDPEAGVAFARAVIRTINTYLDGDYHGDTEVMAVIEGFTMRPADELSKIDSLIFDWQLHEGASAVFQQAYIDLGVITAYSEPLSEDVLIDRSFYHRAVLGP